MWDWLRISLLAVSLLLGCSPADSTAPPPKTRAALSDTPRGRHLDVPPIIMEVMDDSLEWCREYWRAEIDRRFDNAVGVLVHGGDLVEGQWVVKTSLQSGHLMPAEELVAMMRQRYPTRTIVLLACNPGHLRLAGPQHGVYYFPGNVWCLPDRAILQETAPWRAFAQTRLDAQDTASSLFWLPRTRLTNRWQMDPTAAGNIFEAVSVE